MKFDSLKRPDKTHCEHAHPTAQLHSIIDRLSAGGDMQTIMDEICTLTNPLHPLFSRKNVVATSQEDDYFEKLLPSLRLASRMLMHPRVIAYWTGMLKRWKYGKDSRMAPNINDDNSFTYEFYVSAQNEADLKAFLIVLADHCPIVCGAPPLDAEYCKNRTGALTIPSFVQPDDLEYEAGKIKYYDLKNGQRHITEEAYTVMWLNREMFGEILRQWSTTPGRPVENIRHVIHSTAIVLLHELTHVGHNLLFGADSKDHTFDRECIAEVGNAMENYVFGGCTMYLGGHPVISTWPSLEHRVQVSLHTHSTGYQASLEPIKFRRIKSGEVVRHHLQEETWANGAIPILDLKCCKVSMTRVGDLIQIVTEDMPVDTIPTPPAEAPSKGRPIAPRAGSPSPNATRYCSRHSEATQRPHTISERLAAGESIERVEKEVLTLTMPVHPIFAPTNCRSFAGQIPWYQDALPGFAMASAILEHDATARFIYGLVELAVRQNGKIVAGDMSGSSDRFYPPKTLTPEQYEETRIWLKSLAGRIEICHRAIRHPGEAYANAQVARQGMAGYDSSQRRYARFSESRASWELVDDVYSHISLSTKLLDASMREWELSGCNLNVEQVRDRLFYFAKIILHELCHVVTDMLFPHDDDEPYLGDDGESGMGFALESYLFGGIITYDPDKTDLEIHSFPNQAMADLYEEYGASSMRVVGPLPPVTTWRADDITINGTQAIHDDFFWLAGCPPYLDMRCCEVHTDSNGLTHYMKFRKEKVTTPKRKESLPQGVNDGGSPMKQDEQSPHAPMEE